MPLAGFEQLHREADTHRSPVTVAVAGGADRTVIEAMRAACDHAWVKPILVGREADIRQSAESCRVELHGFSIVDSEDAADAAVALVRRGGAQLLMKGQIGTAAFMRAVLDPVSGLRTNRVICQVVLMEIQPAGRSFLLTDTGICIQPSLEQKIDILKSTVDVARTLGADRPRVAVMAATEKVDAAMPETLDAAELQRRNQDGDFPDCVVQGPLSFDLAYAADAGVRKQMSGPTLGSAEIMLFPNLLSANLTVKAIMYTANCRFAGVLCGAACPVAFMSRADSTATRRNSLALALRLIATATSTCTMPRATC
jgi:phosphate butyryltransferase